VKSAPLYLRVKDALLRAMPAGKLPHGARLPTEAELMRTHNVSRATVRKALDLLRHEGLIERFARRGTFVSPKPAATSWTANSLEDVLQLGAETQPEWFEWKALQSPAAASQLGVAATHELFRLRSIRSHAGEPVYFLEAYVASHLGRRLSRRDLSSKMLFDAIEQKLGIPMPKAQEEICADVADKKMARRLGVAPGAPLLVLEVTYFGVDGRPVEYAKAWYRADKFRRRHSLSRDWVAKKEGT
jgi:GntR family transcriptional regulator